MPYALFEKEAKLSRAFPTATDVWRCAEGCGLVVDGADGKPRLEDDSRGRLKHQAVRAGPGPGRGTGLGPEPAKNLTCAGTKPTPRSYPGKCSNLERGESMKDPVSIFGCWRGFSFGAAWQHPLRTSAKGANKGVEMPIAVLLARTILTTTRSSAVAGSENGAPRPCR